MAATVAVALVAALSALPFAGGFDVDGSSSGSVASVSLDGGDAESYTTIDAAWSAAKSASSYATVTLLADATASGQLTLASDKTITLDMNGHTLTASGESYSSGGMFYLTAGTLEVCDGSEDGGGTIAGGTATSGGAFYVGKTSTSIWTASSSATLTVADVTVSGNSAKNGGAFYLDNGTLTVSGSIVSGNAASSNGGAFYCSSNGTLTVSDSTVSGNTSGGSGGGIYTSSGTISGSTVSGNTSDGAGGGIYVSSTLDLSGSTVSGNTSGGSGGGIYTSSGTLAVSESTVSGNTATFSGGGIYTSSGTLTVSDSALSGNIGYGLYVDGSDAAVYLSGEIDISSNCSAFGSMAADYGVYLVSDAVLTKAGDLDGSRVVVTTEATPVGSPVEVIVSGGSTVTAEDAGCFDYVGTYGVLILLSGWTLYAAYCDAACIVTVSAGDGGSVDRDYFTVPVGTEYSAEGDVMTFTYAYAGTEYTVAVAATADAGQSFESWSSTGGTVTGDLAIAATFASGSDTFESSDSESEDSELYTLMLVIAVILVAVVVAALLLRRRLRHRPCSQRSRARVRENAPSVDRARGRPPISDDRSALMDGLATCTFRVSFLRER